MFGPGLPGGGSGDRGGKGGGKEGLVCGSVKGRGVGGSLLVGGPMQPPE